MLHDMSQLQRKAIHVSSNESESEFIHNLANEGFKREAAARQELENRYLTSAADDEDNDTGNTEGGGGAAEEQRKYTQKELEDAEARGFDSGYTKGYKDGLQDGWSKGFDAGLRQAKREEEGEL